MPAKRKCKVDKVAEPSKLPKRKCKIGSILRSETRNEDLNEGEVDSKQVLLEDMKAIGYVYRFRLNLFCFPLLNDP